VSTPYCEFSGKTLKELVIESSVKAMEKRSKTARASRKRRVPKRDHGQPARRENGCFTRVIELEEFSVVEYGRGDKPLMYLKV
jgi:hypothetical protein